LCVCIYIYGPGSSVGIATELRAGRIGDRIPVEARFSTPVQSGPGAHPAYCAVGTGSFPGVKSGRVVTQNPHPILVPWSIKRRAIPLLPQWAVRPVQSLSVCTRVHLGKVDSTPHFNPLTPNDPYRGRTAPLTSKVAFYIFIQQI
jgi:hypothetical protein